MKTTIFVWQIESLVKMGFEAFRDWCINHGISRVVIKVCDGVYAFNLASAATKQPPNSLLLKLKSVLKEAGIELAGYGYAYGADPVGEGRIAADRIVALGLETFVIDAEGEWERLPSPGKAVIAYMVEMFADLPRDQNKCKIALSSFRFKQNFHDAFPFETFLHYGVQELWPQVYWVGAHNAGAQLKKSVLEMAALSGKPIIPIGAMYGEGSFNPTVLEMADFFNTAKEMGLKEIAWWAFDDNGPETRPEWAAFLEKVRENPTPISHPTPDPIVLNYEDVLKRLIGAHHELFSELFENGKVLPFRINLPVVTK